MHYRKNDNYYDYKYDTVSIKDSLYYGLNNFIFHIIEILKTTCFDNLIAMLKLLDIYKKIMYNLNITNITLDNKNYCYVSDKDKEYFSKNMLLINIYIKYNKLQKVKIHDTICMDLCNIHPKYVLYPKIYILNKYKNNYEKFYCGDQLSELVYNLYFKSIKIKFKNNYKKYVRLGVEENKNNITILKLYFKNDTYCILCMSIILNIIMYRVFIILNFQII